MGSVDQQPPKEPPAELEATVSWASSNVWAVTPSGVKATVARSQSRIAASNFNMVRTAVSLLLVAFVCFGTTGTSARPLRPNGRALQQTYVTFPGGYVNQDGGNVQVQYPGGSTQVAEPASPTPSPSSGPSNNTSPSPSPSPVNVEVTAPDTNVAVQTGRKLQQTYVSFPGGYVNQDGGNVQVQYPGGTTQVEEPASPSPSPSPSNKTSSPPSPSPVDVGVAAPYTNVAVQTGRKLQQTSDISFPGGSVRQSGGNVNVEYPGGTTQVEASSPSPSASPSNATSPSPSPSPSNGTSPSPSPSPVPVEVGVTAPGTTVGVNTGRK